MAAIPAPMPASTANWHWKNKTLTKWGHQWFKDELVSLKVTGDKEGEAVWISDVFDIDGDIELGQRKSKCVLLSTSPTLQRYSATTCCLHIVPSVRYVFLSN